MASKADSKIAIELNRTLHGWGAAGDRIEVDHTPEVDDMISNELVTRIAKSELPGEPTGLMAQGPVSEAGNAAAAAVSGQPV